MDGPNGYDEPQAIAQRYARRAAGDRYSPLKPDVWQTLHERQREMIGLFNKLGFNEMWIQFGQGHLDVEENNEELYRFATEIAPRFSDKDAEGTLV